MRILCWLLLALVASGATARAGGLALRWDECHGDGGAIDRNFACDVNSGTNDLIGSFITASDVPFVNGSETILQVASASASLPAWWSFMNAGSCRTSSLTIDFVASPLAVNCVDYASGQSAGGIGAYTIGIAGPNTARITAASGVPTLFEDLLSGQEYFAFRLRIHNLKTVGTGACAGCDVPVCIVWQSLKLTTQLPGYEQEYTTPLNGTDSHYATWQGGGVPVTPRGSGCPAATPARRGTWGEVKAMYR